MKNTPTSSWSWLDLAEAPPYPDFDIADEYKAALAEHAEGSLAEEFTTAVKWALARDFDGMTLSAPGRQDRAMVMEARGARPTLLVWVGRETPTLIHLYDITEP